MIAGTEMNDSGGLIPISDEQAKLGQEVVRTVRDTGGYLADILGDAPKDLFGLLVGDKLKVRRAEHLAITWEKAKQLLRDQGIINPEPISPKLAIPMLE